MTGSVQRSSYTAIDPATTVDLVVLTVADLTRSVNFYTIAVRDPWQNTLLLQVNAIHDPQAATKLASHNNLIMS